MPPDGTLQELLDRQAVADVMSHYARAIDERDVEGFAALFRPDVEVVGFGPETLTSADAWIAFVTKTLEGFAATQHMLGPQLAEIEGDRAHARTDLQAIHRLREPRGQIFTLWGTYQTQMQREPSGAWRISRHELVVRATEGAPAAVG